MSPVPPVRGTLLRDKQADMELIPVKQAAAAVETPRVRPEQVVLGAKSTRYSNIEALLSRPAYQTRNSKFVVQVSGGRKEVLRDDAPASASDAESRGGSLFD